MTAGEALFGGTWNVKRDRSPVAVISAIEDAFRRHDLDFLAVQEFADYAVRARAELRTAGLEVVAFPADNRQNGLIVRAGLLTPGTPASVDLGGDGWHTKGGDKHVAPRMTTARVGGWLRVGSVHMPVALDWHGDHRQPTGPAERLDDYSANAHALARYGKARIHSDRGLAVWGDWNDHLPAETGPLSSVWIAERAGMSITYPHGKPPRGHRGIDYVLHDDDVRIDGIAYGPTYGSDHPIVTARHTHTPNRKAHR